MHDARTDIFSEVLDEVLRTPMNDRPRLLQSLCHGNNVMQLEIESLLKHETKADALFARPFLHHQRSLSAAHDGQVPADPCPPGFKLIRVLGQGASGVVYLAQQFNPQRLVAIKVLRPVSISEETTRRMIAEAHLLARLEHPSIVRVYQAGVMRTELWTQPYLVMEYIEGTELTMFLQSSDTTLSMRSSIFAEICEAVRFAHERGVIHRDLKPSNVLVTRVHEDSVGLKLIDFGIAKVLNHATIPIEVRTLDSSTLGTLRYMSPERLTGTCNGGTVASDVYSLGMLAADLFPSAAYPAASSSPLSAMQRSRLASAIDAMIDPSIAKRTSSAQMAAMEVQHALHSKVRIPHRYALRCGAIGIGIATVSVVFSILNRETTAEAYREKPRDIAREGAMLRVILPHENTQSPEEAASSILCMNQYAGSFLIDGQVDKALEQHVAIQDRLRLTTDLPAFVVAQAHIGYGYSLVKAGLFDDARKAYLQAQSSLESVQPGNDSRIAESWSQIAHGRQSCGDLAVARSIYQSLITHDEFRLWSWHARTTILAKAGGLEWLDKQYSKAESLLRRALHERLDQDDGEYRLKKAEIQVSLAVVLRSQNLFAESDVLLESAIAQHVELRSPIEPDTRRYMQHLATNRLLQNDYVTAMRITESTRDLWSNDSLRDRAERAYCDFIIGSALLVLGEPQHSLLRLHKAKESLPKAGIDSQRLLARINNAFAVAQIKFDNRLEGERLLEQSTQEIFDFYGHSHPWTLLAISRCDDAAQLEVD